MEAVLQGELMLELSLLESLDFLAGVLVVLTLWMWREVLLHHEPQVCGM